MNTYNMSDDISGLGGLSRKARIHRKNAPVELGLGANFFEQIGNVVKKITNVGKEVQTGVKVVGEIKKIAAGTHTEPPMGIKAGDSPLEPQIPTPKGLDTPKDTLSIPTSYLLYGGLAVAGALAIVALRNKN